MRGLWLAGASLILFGCGAAELPSTGERRDAQPAVATPAKRDEPADVLLAEAQFDKQPDNQQPPGKPDVRGHERKIIYTADVALVVEDFQQFERDLSQVVSEFAGFLADVAIDRTQGDQLTGRWVVRVPFDRFQPCLERLESLGVAEHRKQSAQEVTEEFVDLQARIVNKRRLEERILKLLETHSGKINDVIEVERELSRVREEIERMEGRLRFLSERTVLATINLSAREERDYIPPQAPTFAARVARAWGDSLVALRRLAESVAIAVVAAAPWLVVVIPGVWLFRTIWRRRQTAVSRPASHPSTL